jgi:hypothetical protein
VVIRLPPGSDRRAQGSASSISASAGAARRSG